MFFCSCIDGLSRRILWLQCGHTNHDPKVIATYFMASVSDVGGFPARVRTDCGTENTVIAAIQTFVIGSQDALIYGTSPGNQRIESWWSFFRRSRAQYWIDFFQALVDCGGFQAGHVMQTDCSRFCFMELIQKDLNIVKDQWNSHRIRPSVWARCPAGVPNELYYVPPAPYEEKLQSCDQALPAQLLNSIDLSRICDDTNFEQYLQYLCRVKIWIMPNTVHDAVALYLNLLPFV